ncbi:MAG: hypothetical protein ACN6QT_03400, partial [Burkholderia contaminans]
SAFPPFRLSAFPPFRLSAFPPFRLSAFPIGRVDASGASMPSRALTFLVSRIEAQDLERAGTSTPIDWAHQHLS